ncbi:MAG: hypothetical protein QOE64_1378, partial [Frankiales bacterium]|nr:hypothetical protein [Frankiales bacterium]
MASVAARALGLAHRELMQPTEAERRLRDAVRFAERGEHPERSAEARLSLAVELITAGHPRAALPELARAAAVLGDAHAQIHNQLALVYERIGHWDEALAAAGRALAIAEAAGDTALCSIVLCNRGITRAYRGDLAAAEADMRRSRDLALEHAGERLAALDRQHNLGWILARRGRLPEALHQLDLAEAGISELGVPLAIYQLDRAEVLLAAGLFEEAREVASRAAEELADAGHQAELADAMLLAARAGLAAVRSTGLGRGLHASERGALAGQVADDARRAAELYDGQERLGWAAAARAVELGAEGASAALEAGLSTSFFARAADIAAELARRGLIDDEEDVRLSAGRAAVEVGDLDAARALLGPIAERRRRVGGRHRAAFWTAVLHLRAASGDRAGALAAARSGLRALGTMRSLLGATELYAAAAAQQRDLALVGLRLALPGRAALVFEWSERLRSAAFNHPPVRPPDDTELATDLERLRALMQERREGELGGEASWGLRRRQAALESSVQRRSRHAVGEAASAGPDGEPPALRAVRARLQGRRLVSLFAVEGRLRALVITARGGTLLDCGSETQVDFELRQLRLALRRAALGQPRSAAAWHTAVARIDGILAPSLAGEGPLVVVPTPALAVLPWTLLPVTRGRTLELSASVSAWFRERPAATSSERRVVLIAGPDLPEAVEEVRAIAGHYPDATVLTGRAATTAQALAALDGAWFAHLACHGSFRADNPQLSALRLHDGPLTVYDLERLSQAPRHVVLSACDSGRSGERAGAELLGLAAAFFALGARSLIASLLPVDDASTRGLMVRLHRHLHAGETPATALRLAQAELVEA